MMDEAGDEALRQLETLIRETAGSARKTRILTERILHELARVAPESRRQRDLTGDEAETEPAWRRAA